MQAGPFRPAEPGENEKEQGGLRMKYCLHHVPPRMEGRWSYTVRSGGAVVESVSADRDVLRVPEKLGGLPVKTLGSYCFGGMDMYAVRLPDTLERIGAYAFSGCENLQAVVIPGSVRCMDETAFEDTFGICLYVEEGSYAHRWAERLGAPFCFGEPDTDGLEEDILVSGDFICALTEDGEIYIREYTGSARMLVIPEALEGFPVVGIGRHAFACCRTLEEVVVPEGVELVGHAAFCECTALRRIWLPDSLRMLGASCFMYCKALECVCIPDDVQAVGFMCFAGCKALREAVLPRALEEIGPMAFCGCGSLEEIALPQGIRSIASTAFSGCSRLHMPVLPQGLDEESRSAFRSCIGWPEEPE